jgi:hypothetical protein
MAQLDMFADTASPAEIPLADPDRVRRKLAAMLAEARGAGGLPAARRRLFETLVPQMTRWLAEDEAAGVRRDFAAALTR